MVFINSNCKNKNCQKFTTKFFHRLPPFVLIKPDSPSMGNYFYSTCFKQCWKNFLFLLCWLSSGAIDANTLRPAYSLQKQKGKIAQSYAMRQHETILNCGHRSFVFAVKWNLSKATWRVLCVLVHRFGCFCSCQNQSLSCSPPPLFCAPQGAWHELNMLCRRSSKRSRSNSKG